ncbi:hypothetical protein HEK616_37500 [Streptomyces nigrescens]|uniref:Uncharacterized protein n=1 Tax=Streptomyces nigrescens TaxID=1920 RepID=A0ABM7ZV92_STRNI|nr:hypothetical protein HEK616_37500 [Streptomyces nigrescens]
MAEDAFTAHRPLLFTIAYEMLGSAADAEDVLQESYLRWRTVDPAAVEHPRAYLVRTVTRQALNHLRAVKARREEYVGTWLPEPIRTAPEVGDDAILAESVSMAMMLVLETLNPTERAVFVLHDVFGYTHGEIAASIGKAETTVRQIAHRARGHVHARRRRFAPDSADSREIIQRFLLAATTGEVQVLMDLLAPDVVVLSDGGGKVAAARRPIVGPADVARFVCGAGAHQRRHDPHRVRHVQRHARGTVRHRRRTRLARRVRDPRRTDHRPLRHAQPGQAAPRGRGVPTRQRSTQSCKP